MDEITTALATLEALSTSPSTSASGPLNTLLEQHLAVARQRIVAGSDPRQVIQELISNLAKSKKEVEKGLKGWYAKLGDVGKAVEKTFPPSIATISDAYSSPPLFADPAAKDAMDKVIMDHLGRRGSWEAVSAMEEETGHAYNATKRVLCEELSSILASIDRHELQPAIEWCEANASFLSAPPHPSTLPYHLHRAVFISLPPPAALSYAQKHLMSFVATQPVLQLITTCLYPSQTNSPLQTGPSSKQANVTNPFILNDTSQIDVAMEDDGASSHAADKQEPSLPAQYAETRSPAPLAEMFEAEFCRRHGLPKEDLLKIAVDLGGRGGALGAIEKARKVILLGDRLGNVREWDELPMEIPLTADKRFHSVFVCPVSKEQATESNPPLMLSCGHVIASESFQRLIKGGRRSAKCPYCPVETSQTAAQRLYF